MHGLALCAGIGGIELGLALALGRSYQTVCYVEREAHAAGLLVARMAEATLDPAPVWDDLTTFDGRPWRGRVDLVSAGAPCQPFSTASRGRKVAVDLFPEVLRVVAECQPRIVFVENVAGARDRLVLLRDELRGMGFCVPPLAEVSSAALGAPHDRDRLWLLAHTHGQEQSRHAVDDEVAGVPASSPFDWRSKDAADRVLGMADGSADRMDRPRVLGNGVVPVVAAMAFLTLAERAGLNV